MVKQKDIFAGLRTTQEKIKRVLLELRKGGMTSMAAVAHLQAFVQNNDPGRAVNWTEVSQLLEKIANSAYGLTPADLSKVCDAIYGQEADTSDARE